MTAPFFVNSLTTFQDGLPKTVPARLHYPVLVQVAVCVLPAMTLVGIGQFFLGAYALFACLFALLAYHLLARRGAEATAIAIAVIPVLMLLRGLFFYNSLQAIFAMCLTVTLSNPIDRARFRRNQPLVYFVAASLVYWLISFLLTGDYFSNFRIVELSLAAANVYVLCGHRSYLATALCGIILSALAMGTALLILPEGARLGITAVSAEISVGNPIALGLAATVGYLLTIADQGRWLLLHKHPVWRIVLNLLTAIALVLSTSRGSWLVTIAGLLLILFFNESGRKTLLACLMVLVVLIGVLLQTERGPSIQHYYDNAVADDRSLDKRTTGRADQWEKFPLVFDASPLWGFGPGNGKAVSLRYTKEGKPWHSLYLLIGAETGVIGLALLGLLLVSLIRRAVGHWRTCHEIVPLLGIVCTMTIGVSVSGIDAISGVFLGLAFTAMDFSALRVMRMRQMSPEDSAFLGRASRVHG